LLAEAVPNSIRLRRLLDLPQAATEYEALDELRAIMMQNRVLKNFIGQGYHGTFTPPVIQRNLFENPAWYTAYTPYQAEISQGRLELLFHFQTLVTELTGLPVAAASLLDESTALAEGITIAYRFFRERRRYIIIAGILHPQTLDVIKTRTDALGIEIVTEDDITDQVAAVVFPWPDTYGVFHNWSENIQAAKSKHILVIVVADPLALTILDAPAKWGADIVVGSIQRFGIPIGFGGPHAGYLAVSAVLTRLIPGRIVGQSIDTKGRIAYRLALQTREQHIRRDKATSNICTAQVLLANMAVAYAIWHGPTGLQAIARRVHQMACRFKEAVTTEGFKVIGKYFFDCVTVSVPGQAEAVAEKAHAGGRLIRMIDADQVGINFDELSTEEDVVVLSDLFGGYPITEVQSALPSPLRIDTLMSQQIFHYAQSEMKMMRFLRRLADKDLALDRTMIPLGSCTMKLNATAEMLPLGWSEVASLHPFAPQGDTVGYRQMIEQLECWLCTITGFSRISLQPNSGAQGEYAGLLAIRNYHEARGEKKRHICLIPESAHGTNPASARMAGMQVAVVRCLENGDVDINDLRKKAVQHSDSLAALMVTYPSTHGVYEEGIQEMCDIVHGYGGQVYFDGANLNALVGLARPADIGADVCHINLHKTFAIPHGGGGPGAGPICVAKHLESFLPGHVFFGTRHAVSSAPFGNASILVITWMYIRMMGPDGLKHATEMAILNANYIAARLSKRYPILYKGKKGRVAHECIVDIRVIKDQFGITVDDIAKRLMDYGFHAPTMSFPVAGTLMIEPTESESKSEIDRLCNALLSIAEEAQQVGAGIWPKNDNPLVNAPHTLAEIVDDQWNHSYSREKAALPDKSVAAADKYWPPISRVDNVIGDRNLICSCPPLLVD